MQKNTKFYNITKKMTYRSKSSFNYFSFIFFWTMQQSQPKFSFWLQTSKLQSHQYQEQSNLKEQLQQLHLLKVRYFRVLVQLQGQGKLVQLQYFSNFKAPWLITNLPAKLFALLQLWKTIGAWRPLFASLLSKFIKDMQFHCFSHWLNKIEPFANNCKNHLTIVCHC